MPHENNSTAPGANAKPAKPYPDFPLYAHRSGQWAKKIRGKVHYFGRWRDPDAALRKYEGEKDSLRAGRKPRVDEAKLTIKDVCNIFLTRKQKKLDRGKISPLTFLKYREATDEMVQLWGKKRLVEDLAPDDFDALHDRMAGKWGIYRLADMMQHVRSVFKHARCAVDFGEGFTPPSLHEKRLHQAKKKPKLFTASEVRRMLEVATDQLRAMIYLGINCGFGNSDCAALPLAAADLDLGMIDFPRPKTGVRRRCPLWPETVDALREALARRPDPRGEEDAALFFLTLFGRSWKETDNNRPVSKETAKLLKRLGINGREGLGFYTLRHTFRTVADETEKQAAVNHIMGHSTGHISEVYRQRISDERLRAVTDYVHRWLFPSMAWIGTAI